MWIYEIKWNVKPNIYCNNSKSTFIIWSIFDEQYEWANTIMDNGFCCYCSKDGMEQFSMKTFSCLVYLKSKFEIHAFSQL